MSVSESWRNYVESTDEWLQAEALDSVRAALGSIADDVVAAIQQEVPDYARPLEGRFGASIRLGTEVALRALIGDEQDPSSDQVYRRLGAGEYRAGRSLDALQSAYRVGARVAWRRISDVAAAAGATAAAQRSLAEAMFVYIDRLAGESVEGYAEAQLSDAGDLDRRRRELAELLIAGAAPEAPELVRAAELARWPLPRRVACLALLGAHAERARHRLSGEALSARRGEATLLVISDPAALEREAARLAERLGVRVGVGPVVSPAEIPGSMRLARRAVALASEGEPSVVAEDRLADIALGAAPEILVLLRSRLLAPLDEETSASRARLEATLLQWLRHRGSQAAVARELGIHPQTVRYRMARLRELIGTSLEDPDRRFALELALRGGGSARR
ncbi:MAG TPA: helix-turn-helix domain-containing protein [Solirubrobacteraceae bacterium]|nr:helix-turn-helix domain-containing protein [Solirubrobacteraceae bacterium]